MPVVDLHTHSTASDGECTPTGLVRRAKARGLTAMALTDHDTFAGTQEALEAGEEAGIRVLRGIELGAKEHKNLHLLGYGFSPADEALTGLCAGLREGRNGRKFRIQSFLAEKGVDIDLAEVEAMAGGKNIGRPHFARMLVQHGFVQDVREAFARYLDTEEYQRIERPKPSAEECVATLKGAGAKVSLAHPYQLGMEDSELEALVRALKGYGLDAIECYYPKHTPAQQAFYLELARKYGLYVTGGSDFHGETVKPGIELARFALDISWLV